MMGRRGEGWVILQMVLFGLILVAPGIEAFPFPLWLRVLGGLILLAGGALGTLGVIALGTNLSAFPKPKEEARLVTGGVYDIVRHPIYTGLILGSCGWALALDSLLGVGLAVILLIFFDLKSRREERWLVEKYPDYPAYAQRVKRLIPWVY